ncbi:MAG: hypothetical protein CM15mP62_21820 [Rhodospirillaceae bacterium]|nr:MAG: hypothetical protein CM15mP62_21820 [Rhodospirillaceae bacterium]
MSVGRYARRAGLFFVESTKVEEEVGETVGDLGLWNDNLSLTSKKLSDFIRILGFCPGISWVIVEGRLEGIGLGGRKPLDPLPKF